MKMVHLAIVFALVMTAAGLLAAPAGAGPLDPSGSSVHHGAFHHVPSYPDGNAPDSTGQQEYNGTDGPAQSVTGDSAGTAALFTGLTETQNT